MNPFKSLIVPGNNPLNSLKITPNPDDIIGKYMSVASKEQIQAIGQLGVAIGRWLNVLSEQFTEIDSSLRFVNRKLDIQIEQQ